MIRSEPGDRAFRIDLKECLLTGCGGELAELSYYERNNWVTVELECEKCHRRFVVKIES